MRGEGIDFDAALTPNSKSKANAADKLLGRGKGDSSIVGPASEERVPAHVKANFRHRQSHQLRKQTAIEADHFRRGPVTTVNQAKPTEADLRAPISPKPSERRGSWCC